MKYQVIHCPFQLTIIIELHNALYDNLYEDVWFDNKALILEKYIKIKSDEDFYVTTLGITDGLIFTALHYIKHFLNKGVGIRQLMDTLIYMAYYRTEIDWDRFNEIMRHLKFNKFIENSIGIGVKYLNFNESEFCEYSSDDTIMSEILTDIELGGVFGKNEVERSGFYMQYTKARFKRFKKIDYQIYIRRWLRPNYFKLIFPSVNSLSFKYPYVKEKPLLYPIAWLSRIIFLLVDLLKGQKAIREYISPNLNFKENNTIEKRMELIRKLDMI